MEDEKHLFSIIDYADRLLFRLLVVFMSDDEELSVASELYPPPVGLAFVESFTASRNIVFNLIIKPDAQGLTHR